MKYLEKTIFLCLQIDYLKDGILFHQAAFADKILKNFYMDKAHTLSAYMDKAHMLSAQWL